MYFGTLPGVGRPCPHWLTEKKSKEEVSHRAFSFSELREGPHHVETSCVCCSRRSCGSGGCACGAGCRGLHWGRNRCLLHSGQDDVGSGYCQWWWSCSGQPGGHSSVSGGSWSFHIIQHPPGFHWFSLWGLVGIFFFLRWNQR